MLKFVREAFYEVAPRRENQRQNYSMQLLDFLHLTAAGRDLSMAQATEALDIIFEGETSSAVLAAFLIALRMKGETANELAGFALSMRRHAQPVTVRRDGTPLLDTCGTGGDGAGTFNISTIAALVAAGAGVRVAKHGNRSISSRCGSADLLEALGARSLNAEQAGRAIDTVGIGFLFAPTFHPAMRHVQPVRQELRLRTVFNLLGPLTNPAGADCQLIGAPSESFARKMAEALIPLKLRRGFVVHGSGMDEISTTGASVAFFITPSSFERRAYDPDDFDVEWAERHQLKGGDAIVNAAIARDVLKGTPGPHRDIVLVNAAMALLAAEKAEDIPEAMAQARDSIDSGRAARKLADYVEFTLDHAGVAF